MEQMIPYSNLSGRSGIVAYSIGPGYIHVEFREGSSHHYEYTESKLGFSKIQQMIRLAQSGMGLNSFIMKYARTGYSRRW